MNSRGKGLKARARSRSSFFNEEHESTTQRRRDTSVALKFKTLPLGGRKLCSISSVINESEEMADT